MKGDAVQKLAMDAMADEEYFDAPLTEGGVAQARAVRGDPKRPADAELFLSSSLRRRFSGAMPLFVVDAQEEAIMPVVCG